MTCHEEILILSNHETTIRFGFVIQCTQSPDLPGKAFKARWKTTAAESGDPF